MCGVNTGVCVSLLPVPLGTWCLRSAAQCRISYLTGDTAASDSELGWMQCRAIHIHKHRASLSSPPPIQHRTNMLNIPTQTLSHCSQRDYANLQHKDNPSVHTYRWWKELQTEIFHLFLTLNSLSQESEMYRYVIHVPAGDLWSRTLTDTFAQTEHALLSFKESLPMAHWRLLKCHDAITLIFVWGFLMFTGSPSWGDGQVSI